VILELGKERLGEAQRQRRSLLLLKLGQLGVAAQLGLVEQALEQLILVGFPDFPAMVGDFHPLRLLVCRNL
jgi:hypothetical protein